MKHVVTLPNAAEPDIRLAAKLEKRTGKLVVNFNRGLAAGGVQWIEPVKDGDKPLTIGQKSA
jgi:hypothetical protein